MKIKTLSIVNVISFGLGALLTILLLKQCSSPVPTLDEAVTKSDTVIVHDTVFPDPIINKIYVKVNGPVKEVSVIKYDSTICRLNRVYQDSLVDSNLVVYYKDSVNGVLLDKEMAYKLKVPLKIHSTTTITDSVLIPVKSYKNGLYLFGEVGGNKSSFNYSVGASFVSKKNYMLGYRYGVVGSTHNIHFGVKIF